MRSQNGHAAAPQPLGPDSLTWKYFGDWRGILPGPWAGTMQNMHPKLGAAVDQHSEFFRERWQRLFRSVYPIAGVVYDGDRAAETAAKIREYHRDLKGVDDQGRRYHALDPDVFYWAHATFFMSIILTQERFGGGLTEDQKRQLFDEHVQWYELYGVSSRPVPKSWEEFQEYWDHMCRDVLEDNHAAREILDIGTIEKPPTLPWLPDELWPLVRPFFAFGFTWLSVGLFDPPVRERLGYRWTPIDRVLHWGVGRMLHVADRFVPDSQRQHPRAQQGMDREAGLIPKDAPLVEAPFQFMPPADQWHDPKHHNPYRDREPRNQASSRTARR
jgi:uncharacterized protein (DUF2236 family)